MENAQASEAALNQDQAASSGAESTQEAKTPTTLDGLLAAMDAPAANDAGKEVATEEQTAGDGEEAEGAEAESESAESNEAAETGEEAEAEEGEKKPSKNFRGRWDHLDQSERRVIELTTKQGLTLAEAQRVVYGDRSQDRQADEAVDQADPIAAIDQEIANAEAEIDSLESQEDEVFEPAERKKLNKQKREAFIKLSDLRAEKRITLREQEHAKSSKAQREQESLSAAVNASAQAAQELYPDAFEAGTELSDALNVELEYLRKSGSPLLNDPDHPRIIVDRLARNLGIARQQAATAKPVQAPTKEAVKPQAVKPSRGVRPVPSGGIPAGEATQSLEQKISEARGNRTRMLELMREHGTPIEELAGRR